MKIKFDSLEHELGLDTAPLVFEKLMRIKDWFQSNISSDIQFYGDETQQFDNYKQVISSYLNDYLPIIQDQEQKANESQYKKLIFSASSMGFDRVLVALNPTQKQLNDKNFFGMTPLHCAALKGHLNTLKTLLSLGANKYLNNQQHQNPFFSALTLPIGAREDLRKKKTIIFKLLMPLEEQYLYQKDTQGDTIVHQMALHGFNDLLKDTLEINANSAKIANNHRYCPIHVAILNGQAESFSLLLHAHGDLIEDNAGLLPIHFAARYGNHDIMLECVKFYNDIDIIDPQGRTPLNIAQVYGNLPAAQILAEYGASIQVAQSPEVSAINKSNSS